MSGDDLRPVFWTVTDIGVLMGRGNRHQDVYDRLYPNFNWSNDNRPWRHRFAAGEIETTNALAEMIDAEGELETRGDIYVKIVFDHQVDLAEYAAAVAAEARRQAVYLSGRYFYLGSDYELTETDSDPLPVFVERWRDKERRLGNL